MYWHFQGIERKNERKERLKFTGGDGGGRQHHYQPHQHHVFLHPSYIIKLAMEKQVNSHRGKTIIKKPNKKKQK